MYCRIHLTSQNTHNFWTFVSLKIVFACYNDNVIVIFYYLLFYYYYSSVSVSIIHENQTLSLRGPAIDTL